MQHFLLSAAARSLSLKKVFRMGEDVAYQTFCQMRWGVGLDNMGSTCSSVGPAFTCHFFAPFLIQN